MKRKQKISLQAKFRYWFDNKMTQGTRALIELLIFSMLFVLFVLGIGIYLFGGYHTLTESIWSIFLHTLDPGVLSGSSGSPAAIIFLTIATLIGLVVTGTLIAIINNWLEDKMHQLRKGYSDVLETNHVVIVGYNEDTFTIIKELIEANRNEKDRGIVVLDDRVSKEDMEDAINYRFPKKYGTNVICRQANIYSSITLNMCGVDNCRSVIVNQEDDFDTIKTILTLSQYLNRVNRQDIYIIAVLKDRKNYNAAMIAGQGYRGDQENHLVLIYFENCIARIIAQSSKQAGLADVFTELFSYEDNEIYIERHPEVKGKTLLQINTSCPNAIVLGYVDRKNGASDIHLNPPADTVFTLDHDLILLAEDNKTASLIQPKRVIDETAIRKDISLYSQENKNVLIIGFSSKIFKIIEEVSKFIAGESRIHVVIPIDFDFSHFQSGYTYEELKDKYKQENVIDQWIEPTKEVADIYDGYYLEKLIVSYRPDTVIVLSDPMLDAEEADAHTLLLLLLLKDLVLSTGISYNLTSEMRKTENQKIAQVTDADNFIVGSNITSLMISQISQTRELWDVFFEIIDEEGSELYVRPASHYLCTDHKADFYTAQAAVARHHAILIGYQKGDSRECIINPVKDEMIDFNVIKNFVVLAPE